MRVLKLQRHLSRQNTNFIHAKYMRTVMAILRIYDRTGVTDSAAKTHVNYIGLGFLWGG